MDERFAIPRTLDDPPLFLLWTFEEALPVIVCAILGALVGKMGILFGIALGVFVAKSLARIKADGGRGLLVRAAFWYTPSEWWFPTLTPSHVREYVGG